MKTIEEYHIFRSFYDEFDMWVRDYFSETCNKDHLLVYRNWGFNTHHPQLGNIVYIDYYDIPNDSKRTMQVDVDVILEHGNVNREIC